MSGCTAQGCPGPVLDGICCSCGRPDHKNLSRQQPSLLQQGVAMTGGVEICPDCALPRVSGAINCPVCHHVFCDQDRPESPQSSAAKVDLCISCDPARVAPEMATRTFTGELIFPLDVAENLIGRRNDNGEVRPVAPLDDPGVSRRHLKITKNNDGGLLALDLGSTNGTLLNGTPLQPGVAVRVIPGDEIEVGFWTKIRLKSRCP